MFAAGTGRGSAVFYQPRRKAQQPSSGWFVLSDFWLPVPGQPSLSGCTPNPIVEAKEAHRMDEFMDEELNEETQVDEPKVPKELRAAYERIKQENQELRGQVRRGAFLEAGINPDEGIGKLLFKSYDGDVDAGKIREFAAEYATPPGESEGKALAWQQSQSRTDRIAASSQPVPPPGDYTQQVDKAVEEEDWLGLMSLQLQAIEQQSKE